MGQLRSAQRKKLPASDFGIPGERKYPMPDASHARAAKSRAAEMANKGVISKSTEDKINRKANVKLGGSSRPEYNHDHLGEGIAEFKRQMVRHHSGPRCTGNAEVED